MTIKLKDLDNILKMVELQRDITVRLHLIKKRSEQNNEELKKVTGLAGILVNLKNKYKKEFKQLNNLDENVIKEINKLLKDRHLKI